MNKSLLQSREYDLRLKPGVRLGYSQLESRGGIIVRLCPGEADDSNAGYGEAAPAWWIGDEPLQTACDAVANACSWFAAQQPDPTDLEDGLREGRGLPSALASILAPSLSATSAIATALADHAARSRGLSLAQYLGGRLAACETNALLVGEDAGTVATDTASALASDYRTVKLKVGNHPSATDIERIQAVLDAGHGRPQIRLDANRGWDLETAATILGAFDMRAFEYVEEPLKEPTPDALRALRERCNVAVALDESIGSDRDIARFRGACDVIVLKPSRSRGPWSLLATARRARESGMAVTLTDSLESAVGRALCLHVAAAVGNDRRASGLAGAALLAEDVTRSMTTLRGATITPNGPGLFDPMTLKPELFT